MGRIRTLGLELLGNLAVQHARTNRDGAILGTGWSDPAVLEAEGFQLETTLTFEELGLLVGSGAGHPNRFLLGTWHGKKVVISQGRVHHYQEIPGQESWLRKWAAILLALMGCGERLVITSSVGGVAEHIKMGMVVRPTGLVSAHIPMPYLSGADGEFVMSEHLLWTNHEESGTKRPLVEKTFRHAAQAADMRFAQGCTHLVVGPGFGGAAERTKTWRSWGVDTVGMSLDPELRLAALENLDNGHGGQAELLGLKPIRVFAAGMVTDDHDLPNHAEITAAARERSPQLGKFLSHVVKSDW